MVAKRMQRSERQGDAVGGEVAAPRALHVAGQGLERRLTSCCVLADEAEEGNLWIDSPCDQIEGGQ